MEQSYVSDCSSCLWRDTCFEEDECCEHYTPEQELEVKNNMIEFLYENDDYSCCQDVGRRWMDLTATQVGSGYEFLNDFEVPWMQQERANNVRGEDLY